MIVAEISGLGVISPVASGKVAFAEALRAGKSGFMVREEVFNGNQTRFPAALITDFDLKKRIDELDLPADLAKKAKRMRNISFGTSCAVYTALEAWQNAGLFQTPADPQRVAIISGGSNTQLRETLDLREKYSEKLKVTTPNHVISLFDTDVNGVISELLDIKGEGYSLGAASASSNYALVNAHRLLGTGQYDVVVVTAPCMHLTAFEYQSFTNLGAMAALTEEGYVAEELCRPFDANPQGFVFGQNSGTLILETPESAAARGRINQVAICGSGTSLDANRNPNPSAEGEARAMRNALESGGISSAEVDYLNAHGTASPLGDKTELEALGKLGAKPVINSTKSLTGHGLTAAGMVEAIATVVQMEQNFIHPSGNLETPVDPGFTFATGKAMQKEIRYALSNGFGFGGINTSLLFKKLS